MTEKPRMGIMENAPRWWPNFTPPEFSERDQLEFERYCRKMVDNVTAEKGMTPWERWKATTAGEIPDRPMVHEFVDPIAISRVLDCWSYSLKPGFDLYNYPELFLKANLAWFARFSLDLPCVYSLWASNSMLEFGGASRAKLEPRMMPSPIKPPVRTMGVPPGTTETDFAKVYMPDITRDGFMPPSIWTIRKIKEFMKKYGAADVIPLLAYIEHMPYPPFPLTGIKEGFAAIKRLPELTHKMAEFMTPFNIEYLKAMREAGADIISSSSELGTGGLEKAKEFDKYFVRIANELGPNHICADSGLGVSTLEFRCQTGSIGPTGWFATADNHPLELQRRLATEYKKIFGVLPFNAPELTSSRDPKHVEELLKQCIKTCAGPGFFQTVHLDYWSTQANLDTFVRVPKEYGRELYKDLRR